VACGYDGPGGTNLKVFSPSVSWSRPWWDTRLMFVASPSLHQAPTLLQVEVMGRQRFGRSRGRVASGLECKCLRITRVIFVQCASPPTASSWLLEASMSSRSTASAHVGGPHLLRQVPLVLSRLQTPLLRK